MVPASSLTARNLHCPLSGQRLYEGTEQVFVFLNSLCNLLIIHFITGTIRVKGEGIFNFIG